MESNEKFMQRCLQLARLGSGQVSPNPLVGAILVHQNRIIGEGWHQQFGGSHAEVNCLNSVRAEERHLIQESTLYVSLEPCAHQGKTPPCADLILEHKIPHVIVSCPDSFEQVNGKGIERLRAAGTSVTLGVLQEEARWQNRRFFTVQERNRPYIILKWAQSANGYLAPQDGKRHLLSNTFSLQVVHQQRSREDAILVGYQTALNDNPRLNNRSGSGRQPFRMVTDFELSLPIDLHLFEGPQQTVIFNTELSVQKEHLHWHKIDARGNLPNAVCEFALSRKLNSIIVEGGAKTLAQFLAAELWDEAFIFQTPATIQQGIAAPELPRAILARKTKLVDDQLLHFVHFDTASVFHLSGDRYFYDS